MPSCWGTSRVIGVWYGCVDGGDAVGVGIGPEPMDCKASTRGVYGPCGSVSSSNPDKVCVTRSRTSRAFGFPSGHAKSAPSSWAVDRSAGTRSARLEESASVACLPRNLKTCTGPRRPFRRGGWEARRIPGRQGLGRALGWHWQR